MTNNEILFMIQYALNLDDLTMDQIYYLSGGKEKSSTLTAFIKNADEAGYKPCPASVITSFLDGLIIYKRGQINRTEDSEENTELPLSNNVILKKLRIALNLKEDQMLEIFKLAKYEISKYELNALFRKEENKHFKKCNASLMNKFLGGLALWCRNTNN